MKQTFEHPVKTLRKLTLKVQTPTRQGPDSRHATLFPITRTQRTLQLPAVPASERKVN